MTLLPNFTIRQMLLAMIGVALLSTCFAGAARGSIVAFGLSVAVISLSVPIVVAAVGYWLVYLLAILINAIIGGSEMVVASVVSDPRTNDECGDRQLSAKEMQGGGSDAT